MEKKDLALIGMGAMLIILGAIPLLAALGATFFWAVTGTVVFHDTFMLGWLGVMICLMGMFPIMFAQKP